MHLTRTGGRVILEGGGGRVVRRVISDIMSRILLSKMYAGSIIIKRLSKSFYIESP